MFTPRNIYIKKKNKTNTALNQAPSTKSQPLQVSLPLALNPLFQRCSPELEGGSEAQGGRRKATLSLGVQDNPLIPCQEGFPPLRKFILKF